MKTDREILAELVACKDALSMPIGDYVERGEAAWQAARDQLAKPQAQGPCEMTNTPRFQIKDCACSTYEGNLGPCATWFEGAAAGRCVYCDHNLDCHVKLSKLLYSPAAQPQSGGDLERHEWDRDGERCVKCGDKDWMAGPVCSAVKNTDTRPCTCHPDDNPPVSCARKYALSECRAAAPQSDRELK